MIWVSADTFYTIKVDQAKLMPSNLKESRPVTIRYFSFIRIKLLVRKVLNM